MILSVESRGGAGRPRFHLPLSAWLVAAEVQDDWDRSYDCLISIGRSARAIATVVLGLVVTKFAPGPGERIVIGLDDTPTQRYGRHVEGAGVHHHPTPGPATLVGQSACDQREKGTRAIDCNPCKWP